MSRQLSQQEIEAFFPGAQGGATALPASVRSVPFDFRRADRIAKSQLRAIHFLHETFVRNLVSSLSAYLRSYVTGNLATVEQLPYAEFLEALPSPTCLVSLSLRPYDGSAVLEMNPVLIFSILELLLGGKGKIPVSLNREITEIEQKLLDRVFRIIMHDLAETWKAIAPIEFNIESLETEPQFLQIITPCEAVVAIGIELRIGEVTGSMNLAIPSITIKMMRQKFDQQWSVRKSESGEPEKARMLELLRKSRICLQPALRGFLRTSDIAGLKVGDVVLLDHPVHRPIDCTVNGKLKYLGQMVTVGSKIGFQIDECTEIPPNTAPASAHSG